MDKRMRALVDWVPASSRVIDVGCDHGQMSLALAERADVGAVLATDISAASLEKLREALTSAPPEVAVKIQTVVADGLADLPWASADTVLIAGMGGPLILRILDAPLAERAATWVLGPQSGLSNVRRRLYGMGRRVDEQLVAESGQFYPFFRVHVNEVVPARELTAFEAAYGPDLLWRHDSVLREKIEWDRRECAGILKHLLHSGERARQRRERLVAEIDRLDAVLAAWEE